jgi:prevent-host-death family protein
MLCGRRALAQVPALFCYPDAHTLPEYLARSRKEGDPIVVTHHGKPYALLQPLSEQDLEELEWKQLARRKLARAWKGEADALYDYL